MFHDPSALRDLLLSAIESGTFSDPTIADRLKAASDACVHPDPVHMAANATLLAKEMHRVITNAWNRWDDLDQDDAPGLGDDLERLASTTVPALLGAQAAARQSADAEGGKVVSSWSKDDMGFLEVDDDLDHLSDDELDAFKPQIFERVSEGLGGALGERGNAYLADQWWQMRETIIADLKIPTKAERSA